MLRLLLWRSLAAREAIALPKELFSLKIGIQLTFYRFVIEGIFKAG
jgi:hypothetical protein